MLPELFARMAHSVLDGSAEVIVTKFFGVLTAIVVGTVSVIVAWNSRKRQRAMASVPPTSAPKMSSDDDETPTQRVTIVLDHSGIDDAEIKRLTWERDDARRLYALAQDDLSRQQRATLQAQALSEVLRSELEELRQAINSGNTRLHLPGAGHAVHVTESYDSSAAPTPQQGFKRPVPDSSG